MKSKLFASGTLLLAFFTFSSYTVNTDDGGRNETLLKLLIQGLTTNHYQPQELDDAFSERVFDLYLKRSDYNKRFFTKEDVEFLSQYRDDIDDETRLSQYTMFDAATEIMEKRIAEVKGYTEEVLAQPFDFTVTEELEVDYDHMSYVENSAELRERWRKFLKYQVLTRLDNGEEASTLVPGSEAFLEKEAKEREKVAKIYADYFRRQMRIDPAERRANYLNTMVSTYDPHTGYFPPKDKENFDIQMSGKLEGIGAQLLETDGFIKVTSIVPGSASYKQGDLKVGDLIIKVAQGDEEPVDVVDMGIDDAIKLIRGKKGTEVRLTVKKIDGKQQVIPIIRDVVELEDTYARSALISDEKGKKVYGYIYLPKFYADFNDRFGRRCATDVAKEIEKLKADNVRGIILDLRDNGGGSLQDVVDMTGLFIDRGPIVQVRSRQGKPTILADNDPRIQFDAPLVVLVNGFSASASEIMAAAIQDYGRGVIIGTPTFGKGTVQRFLDLDEYIREDPELKPLGEVKLTTQKFYRINGGSTQLKGVTPDIILPDEYSLLDMGEKDQDYYLQWDEIAAANYTKFQPAINKRELALKSEARVSANQTFALIAENAERFKRQQARATYPLNWSQHLSEQKLLDSEATRFKDYMPEITGWEINFPTADVVAAQSDTIAENKMKVWAKDLKKDPYIHEAMMVLQDWK